MILITILSLVSFQPLPPVAVGVASFYTIDSSSALTASGEPMDDDALTCAMRHGQFGRRLLVVADNGKHVVCKLNDRGPYKRGRVIDLSEAAMKRLGGLKRGLLRVKVYRLGYADH